MRALAIRKLCMICTYHTLTYTRSFLFSLLNKISGEPARYTYWASDQPGSIFGSLEDCALMEMGLGGHWGDYSCDGILFSKERHGWVCEYHKI